MTHEQADGYDNAPGSQRYRMLCERDESLKASMKMAYEQPDNAQAQKDWCHAIAGAAVGYGKPEHGKFVDQKLYNRHFNAAMSARDKGPDHAKSIALDAIHKGNSDNEVTDKIIKEANFSHMLNIAYTRLREVIGLRSHNDQKLNDITHGILRATHSLLKSNYFISPITPHHLSVAPSSGTSDKIADDALRQTIIDRIITDNDNWTLDERELYIDGLTLGNPEDNYTFPVDELYQYLLFANTTWRSGQPEKARAKGKPDIVSPDRPNLVPFDLMIYNLHKNALSEGKSDEEALIRVAWELWKDAIELKNAVAEREKQHAE